MLFLIAISQATDHFEKQIIPSSISISIATYPQHGSNTDELADVAEAALNRANAEGKDRLILLE